MSSGERSSMQQRTTGNAALELETEYTLLVIIPTDIENRIY